MCVKKIHLSWNPTVKISVAFLSTLPIPSQRATRTCQAAKSNLSIHSALLWLLLSNESKGFCLQSLHFCWLPGPIRRAVGWHRELGEGFLQLLSETFCGGLDPGACGVGDSSVGNALISPFKITVLGSQAADIVMLSELFLSLISAQAHFLPLSNQGTWVKSN